VDAYDGTVTLYAWDDKDPILKAWESAFPGVVKPRKDIPSDLLEHFRYPEDMYKVQRNILAEYHVLDPKSFYGGNDRWQVPQDPNDEARTQPPYRLSVSTTSGSKPVFSLTSVYVPYQKQNLAAFMSVGADATDPSTYGRFQILRLPDNEQVSGPSQISNRFTNDNKVATVLRNFRNSDAKAIYGNLLTLPVGGGLLYVQPLYTLREGGSGNYPVLNSVLASFGNSVGIGNTLSGALNDILNGDNGTTGSTDTGTGGGSTGTGGGGGTGGSTDTSALPTRALQLLQQADQAFAAADRALKAGNLNLYAQKVNEGRALVNQALTIGKRSAPTPSATPSAKASGKASGSAGPSATPGASGTPSP
jgi:uncharacterized membrane protein (UPF0182 family)